MHPPGLFGFVAAGTLLLSRRSPAAHSAQLGRKRKQKQSNPLAQYLSGELKDGT